MNKLKELAFYYYTLKDVGFLKICKRIIFNLRILIEKNLFKFFLLFYKKHKSLWSEEILSNMKKIEIKKEVIKNKRISLNFLNQNNEFYLPIKWDFKSKSRLWNFNLHYFDYGMDLLEEGYKFKEKILYSNLEHIIDSWIDYNSNKYTDGWHSYTLSLRIRNWIWFFRSSTNLITKKRIDILWFQILWLNNHQEEYLGGNHYLENLMTLVFSSLQFKNSKSIKIYENTLPKLKQVLEEQILSDGGHEERSASYHICLLKRLVETAIMIQVVRNYRPKWILFFIDKMLNWSKKIRLTNSKYPRFNDSFFSKDIKLDQIIKLSESYLKEINLFKEGSFYFALFDSFLNKSNLSKLK